MLLSDLYLSFHFIFMGKPDGKSSHFIAENSTERLSNVRELLQPVNLGPSLNKGGSVAEEAEPGLGDTTQTGDYFCPLPPLSPVKLVASLRLNSLFSTLEQWLQRVVILNV